MVQIRVIFSNIAEYDIYWSRFGTGSLVPSPQRHKFHRIDETFAGSRAKSRTAFPILFVNWPRLKGTESVLTRASLGLGIVRQLCRYVNLFRPTSAGNRTATLDIGSFRRRLLSPGIFASLNKRFWLGGMWAEQCEALTNQCAYSRSKSRPMGPVAPRQKFTVKSTPSHPLADQTVTSFAIGNNI